MSVAYAPKLKPTIVDRIVGYFNPTSGLRRTVARELLTRAYEGASKRDGWNPRRAGASANADHQADATTLRVRCRALEQNVPYVASALRALVSYEVGIGIVPRWLGVGAEAYDKLWAQWAPHADADGLSDVYGLQSRAVYAMRRDGEVLLRIRTRRAEDRLPVPVQFQLLEIDWLDSQKQGDAGSNTIVNGIEYDRVGRRAAYWLFDQHPGDATTLRSLSGTSRRIAAEQIIHLFAPERPGQGRGFPRIAPVIADVRDLRLYEDAEIQRKNLETRLSVIASPDVSALGEGVDMAALQRGDLGDLRSGGITQAPPGVNFTVLQPHVAPGYVDYVKQKLHTIAVGIGIPYETMTGDMSGVNYSSARIRRLDFKRDVEMSQWLTIVPVLCMGMCRAFAEHAYLAGKVKAVSTNIDHSTPRWDYVNPLQDVQADNAEIAGGLTSFSEKMRQRGMKPELVFSELEKDMKRLRDTGILDMMLALNGRSVVSAGAMGRGNDDPQETGDAKVDEGTEVDESAAQKKK